ncbi:MAG: hypothetical protein DRO15_04935 [Thermoprotei archaeon]|nr:MAG: hypothetical protein DRO15_04935 [Thermoprotei archaeon]
MISKDLARYLISLAIVEGVLKSEVESIEFRKFVKQFIKRLFLGSDSTNEINELIASIIKEFSDKEFLTPVQLLKDLERNTDIVKHAILCIINKCTRTISKETITSLEVLKTGNYKLFSELYITPYICSAIEIGCRAKAPARLYDIERTRYAIILRSDCIPISRLLSFIFGDIIRFIPYSRGIGHSGFYEIAAIPRILLRDEIVEALKNIYLRLMPKTPMISIKTNNVKQYIEKSFDLITEIIISGPCLTTKGMEFLVPIISNLGDQGSWIYIVHRGCSPTDIICSRGGKQWISCIEAEEELMNYGVEICLSQNIVETNIVINREVVISGNGNVLEGENFLLYIIGDKIYAEERASKLLKPCICSSVLLQSPIYPEENTSSPKTS